jgi:Transposase and inactivated derivatives
MPTGYQIKQQDALHYVTLQIVYWVDIFTRRNYRDIIIESLRYCQQSKGLEIYSFVIMSNHVHLVIRSETGDLSGTLRDLKKYTSKRIIEAIETETESRKDWMLRLFSHAAKRQNKKGDYQLWTHENHAIQLYSNEVIQQKVDYIHLNPVRNGIVERPEEYLYSSAKAYSGLEALLNVIMIDRKWKTYS